MERRNHTGRLANFSLLSSSPLFPSSHPSPLLPSPPHPCFPHPTPPLFSPPLLTPVSLTPPLPSSPLLTPVSLTPPLPPSPLPSSPLFHSSHPFLTLTTLTPHTSQITPSLPPFPLLPLLFILSLNPPPPLSLWSMWEETHSSTRWERLLPSSGALGPGWWSMVVGSSPPLSALLSQRLFSVHKTCTCCTEHSGYMPWLSYKRYGTMETFRVPLE